MKAVKQYKNDGYYLAKSILSNDFCNELKSYLEHQDAKINIPFSNIPWGYGNLIDEGPFKEVIKQPFIKDFVNDLFGDSFIYNHLMVNNKASWIGSAVEFHQEIFNVDSYAPGYSVMEWSNFMQIYIALDEHTIENGCLVIFPGSHKLGVLPCEDIVGDNFGHKRRVTHDGMKFAYKNCGKKMVLMQPGDILFFNHLTIHGSGTNVSEKDRKSIVLQARKTTREKDEQVFEKETSYRRKFVIDSLSAKVDKLKSVNMYRDFK